jgi:hypothetical protein
VKRVGAAVMFALWTTNVLAGGWVGPFPVARINPDDTLVYFLRPDGMSGFPNPDNCPNATYLAYDSSQKLIDRALAVGLAAKAMGKQVRHWVSGCTPGGYIRATGKSFGIERLLLMRFSRFRF